MLAQLSSSKVLILGAGVTGSSLARALKRRGAEIAFVDENITRTELADVYAPSKVVLQEWDFVVTSPGWRPHHPFFDQARSMKKPILNEVDIAWWIKQEVAPSQRWIALTGTNGKTSTVELTAAILRNAGVSALACGNVGTTVIDALESGEGYEYLVVELSSFQLHWMAEPSFAAVAILNIAQDHIDWHGSFEAYALDKAKILDRAEIAILNGDDGAIVKHTQSWKGRKVFFTLNSPQSGELGVVEDLLVDRAFVPDPLEASLICEVGEVQPRAPHTISNSLAAAGLARAVGIAHESIRSSIAGFTPGRHRIELVHESNGVRWVDDSKATNPHAALASLFASPSNIWIAGGLLKGADITPLIKKAADQMKAVIVIGQDGQLIERAFLEHAPHVRRVHIDPPSDYERAGSNNSLMEEIVRAAQALASAGDTVLLAPAAASMDQFISYADRGDRFAAAVKALVR